LTLTHKQIEAVEHATGPLLILAGAGTGKTTTITGKIAYLIEKCKVEPGKILALTFSREAARNMEQKIHEYLGYGIDVKVSTFHAFCAELIRNNAEKCVVTEQFTIFEDKNIDAAILLYKELGITTRNADIYSTTIAMAKDLNISIDDFKKYLETNKESLTVLLKKICSSNFMGSARLSRLSI
jgi:DNA helicase II / ATP-dependent DNA helicase PcrA